MFYQNSRAVETKKYLKIHSVSVCSVSVKNNPNQGRINYDCTFDGVEVDDATLNSKETS